MSALFHASKTILECPELLSAFTKKMEALGKSAINGAPPGQGFSMPQLLKAIKTLGLTYVSTDDITQEAKDAIKEEGLPTMFVENGSFDPDSDYWKGVLASHKNTMKEAIQSVGQIQKVERQSVEQIGTGWFIKSDVIVTNFHVAEAFAHTQSPFDFKVKDLVYPYGALLDTKVERGNGTSKKFKVSKVLYMESSDEADVAFLKVEPLNGAQLPRALELDTTVFGNYEALAVVGYPSPKADDLDHMNPNQLTELKEFFPEPWGVKRFQCGHYLAMKGNVFRHSCPTLHGSSGSPVFSLKSGRVVGLHFYGKYLEDSLAMTAAKLKAILDEHT